MVTVKVILDNVKYGRLVRARKREGVPSVAAYLLFRAGELDDEVEAQEIVAKAFRRAPNKATGENFRLRDLFPSADWSAFTKGARLRAGRMFHERVSEALDGITTGPKGSGNHQTYVRRGR